MADSKEFTRKEVSEIDPKEKTVFIIDNVVYDVSAFLDEHPGGHEVLAHAAGRDASEEFRDVSHSLDARELMRKYALGELVAADRVQTANRAASWEERSEPQQASFLSSWKFPLLVGVLLSVLYTYLFP